MIFSHNYFNIAKYSIHKSHQVLKKFNHKMTHAIKKCTHFPHFRFYDAQKNLDIRIFCFTN